MTCHLLTLVLVRSGGALSTGVGAGVDVRPLETTVGPVNPDTCFGEQFGHSPQLRMGFSGCALICPLGSALYVKGDIRLTFSLFPVLWKTSMT